MVPAELAVRTYKLYGDQTISLLYDDPYLLMDEGLDLTYLFLLNIKMKKPAKFPVMAKSSTWYCPWLF